MALPSGFNEFEHLQDMIRREHNKAVRAYFKNQEDDDISTPKAALKHACLLKDEDTATMTLMRQWLFEVTIGRMQSIQTPVYGVPVSVSQSTFKFVPQVKLYFKESQVSEQVRQGLPPIAGEITFRLINKTSETITRNDAEVLAREIKNEFATPIVIWEKGKYVCTYFDNDKGYQIRLHVKNKAEGERIIKKVLAVRSHTFEASKFQFVDNDKIIDSTPGTHRVYGRTVKKFRERPTADVKFKYAQLLIWGQQNAVNLVSVGGRHRSVIERV
jgi:hypothetical protein